METLTWLHLSDWHQGNKGRMDRRVVRDALIADIKQRATQCHERLADLDFVIFSGDLAFRGAEEEYGAAETEFLDRVLEAANVTRDRLFMVPGNHDVDRSRLNFLPDFLLKFDERSKVIEAFEDAEIRAHLLFPMKAYSTFVKRFMKDVRPFDPEYGFIHQLKPIHAHTKSVAILGLNSAWMCGHFKDSYRKGEVNDYGRLILGEHQYRESLSIIEQQRPDLVIAVMHHPFPWFSETEDRSKLEDELIKECHFILRGHEHKSAVTIPYGTAGECAVISAGSAYDRRDYPNGYNYVMVDFERGQGTVHLRRYDDWRREFRKDSTLTSEESPGFVTFTLPKDLGRRGKPSRHVLLGNPWGVQSPVTMQAIAEVYNQQHEPSKFIQVSGQLLVEANSLLPEPEADLVITRVRFRTGADPIYCHRVSLMWAEGSDFQGDVSFSVRGSKHGEIDVISVPITVPDARYSPSDPRHSYHKQLLLFFNPILKPGGEEEYTLEVYEKIKTSLEPLPRQGKDDLFIVPTRSLTPVRHLSIVVLTPRSFGEIEMRQGGRDTTKADGRLMSAQEIGADLTGLSRFQRREDYDAYGWHVNDAPNGCFFAVDLTKKPKDMVK